MVIHFMSIKLIELLDETSSKLEKCMGETETNSWPWEKLDVIH